LSGVREQVHDDRSSVDGLGNVKQGLALDPTVLLGLLPGLSALSDTDDDVETLVSRVEGLSVTLGSVTNHGERVVLEVAVVLSAAMPWRDGKSNNNTAEARLDSLLQLVKRPIGPLVDLLFCSGKVQGFDTSHTGGSDGGGQSGSRGVSSSEGHGPLGDGGLPCGGSERIGGGSLERHGWGGLEVMSCRLEKFPIG
jgi:hypothetical protein